MAGPILQPVTAMQTIAAFGTSLREGHRVIDLIAAGEAVVVDLTIPNGRDAVADFASLGIRARIAPDPDVDVRAIREGLAMTQPEFASRFGLELDMVRDWEQGRLRPDPTATVLLRVIQRDPEAVVSALATASPI